MFLKHLTLTNIRCFERIELNFEKAKNKNRKWTLLLGENGTGKTTVLRAAALVTSGSDALAELVGEPGDWIRLGTDAGEITAILETKSGEERKISIEFRKGDSLSSLIARCKDTLQLIDDAIEHAERNYFVAAYGSSRRLNPYTGFEKRSRYGHVRARSIATLFDPDMMLNPLESWAMELDYRTDGEGIKAVRQVLDRFLPGMQFAHIDKESRQLMFKTADGIVPLNQLSDGYQNVAAWMGDLLYRVTNIFEDYKSPLKARGLLIVDEVDLHLHPKWQRALHNFLTRRLPNMQLLVTTHSPVTAQQAAIHQIHFLKRDNRSVSLYQFEADPSEMLIGQLLLSEAFGMSTDESVAVENKKTRYRKLRDSKQLSQAQRSELKSLRGNLRNTVKGGAENLKLVEDQTALLKKIKAELKDKKS